MLCASWLKLDAFKKNLFQISYKKSFLIDDINK